MNLRTLTNDELLRVAAHEFNELSGTDLEAELLRRLQNADEAFAQHEPLLNVLEQHDQDDPKALDELFDALGTFTAAKVAALLDALGDFDIDDAEQLRRRLEKANEFDQALEDPAAFIASLSTTTE